METFVMVLIVVVELVFLGFLFLLVGKVIRYLDRR